MILSIGIKNCRQYVIFDKKTLFFVSLSNLGQVSNEKQIRFNDYKGQTYKKYKRMI